MEIGEIMKKLFAIPATAMLGAALAIAPQAVVAAPAVSASAEAPSVTGYQDVFEGDWEYTEGWTTYVTEHGLMSGTADASGKATGNFEPNRDITRGEVATVLYRIAHPGTTDTTEHANAGVQLDFKVQGEFRFYNIAINWCKEVGIVTGDQDASGNELGTFRPDDDITRQELATMIYRFAKWHGAEMLLVDPLPFLNAPDHNDVQLYARIPLSWTADRGVMTGVKGGKDDGKLMPHEEATRAQAAKMFTVLDRDVL